MTEHWSHVCGALGLSLTTPLQKGSLEFKMGMEVHTCHNVIPGFRRLRQRAQDQLGYVRPCHGMCVCVEGGRLSLVWLARVKITPPKRKTGSGRCKPKFPSCRSVMAHGEEMLVIWNVSHSVSKRK